MVKKKKSVGGGELIQKNQLIHGIMPLYATGHLALRIKKACSSSCVFKASLAPISLCSDSPACAGLPVGRTMVKTAPCFRCHFLKYSRAFHLEHDDEEDTITGQYISAACVHHLNFPCVTQTFNCIY